MLSSGGNIEGAYKGMWHGWKMILEEEGVRGLWRGLVPGLFGIVNGALHFAFYEEFKKWNWTFFDVSSTSGTGLSEMERTTSETGDGEGVGVGVGLNAIGDATRGDTIGVVSAITKDIDGRGVEVGLKRRDDESEGKPWQRQQQKKNQRTQNERKREKPPGTVSTILSSALAKSLAMLLTYPHQLIRARMQTYHKHSIITSSSSSIHSEMIKGDVRTVSDVTRQDNTEKKAKEKMEEKKTREEMKRKGGQSISIPRLISSIWRNEGMKGFYKGYAFISLSYSLSMSIPAIWLFPFIPISYLFL